jgi:ParB family chromosome partitioning protein
MNIQHSSRQDDWGTPDWLIAKVKEVLGNITLDPASCSAANKIVGAEIFYTKEDNGLFMPWKGKVFLNPPGGKSGKSSNTKLFWDKLSMGYENNEIEEAVFMGFSVEALQTTQGCKYPIMRYPFCVPSKRVQFVNLLGEAKYAPSHSNVIVYLGRNPERFEEVFKEIGAIKR